MMWPPDRSRIDENGARPAGLIDMRNGVADPGWRIPFGDLEQGLKRPVVPRGPLYRLLIALPGPEQTVRVIPEATQRPFAADLAP